MKKYVITGGPCAGKSTLIDRLAKDGYSYVPEAARMLIEEDQEREMIDPNYKGTYPWENLKAFQGKVLKKQGELENKIENNGNRDAVFLDRGYHDVIAYCELGGIDIERIVKRVARNANYDTVFYLEMPSDYVNDACRKEPYEKACNIGNKICDVYQRMGFNVKRLPDVGLEARARMVKDYVSRN